MNRIPSKDIRMSDTEQPIAKRLRKRSDNNTPHASIHSRRIESQSTIASSSNENHGQQQSDSLLQLSDECLQKLFAHLKIESLCEMTNVCKRFRKIAEQVFAQKHKEFVVKNYDCKMSTFRRVLCKFGHLITLIDAFDAYFAIDNYDAAPITKYCPKNLEKLSVQNAQINCALFKPLFSRLKGLELNSCDFIGNANDLFKSCSMLENMYFEANEHSCNYVVQAYPKMTGLVFDSNFSSSIAFLHLLPMNPQLKHLHIMTMADDTYIDAVTRCTKNLERLRIRPGFMSSTPEIQTRKVFLRLAKLNKLKKLSIDAGYETYGKLLAPLIDAFVKGKVALEELDVRDFEIGSKEIKSIAKLNTLTLLWLDTIESVLTSDLVSLTTNLPLLNNLRLHSKLSNRSTAPMTINGLIEMVKAAKKLEYLIFDGMRNLNINQKEFAALLKAVQSRGAEKRLLIQIIGCKSTTSFTVPETIQKACAKELKFVYMDDQGECECDECGAESE